MPTGYKSARNSAFHRQNGRCYYCRFPMWLLDRPKFAAVHGLTLGQASLLKATGEHLIAQQDGGKHGNNVVAACHHCNQARHRFRPGSAPSHECFLALVRRRVKQKRWHSADLFQAMGATPRSSSNAR